MLGKTDTFPTPAGAALGGYHFVLGCLPGVAEQEPLWMGTCQSMLLGRADPWVGGIPSGVNGGSRAHGKYQTWCLQALPFLENVIIDPYPSCKYLKIS